MNLIRNGLVTLKEKFWPETPIHQQVDHGIPFDPFDAWVVLKVEIFKLETQLSAARYTIDQAHNEIACDQVGLAQETLDSYIENQQ